MLASNVDRWLWWDWIDRNTDLIWSSLREHVILTAAYQHLGIGREATDVAERCQDRCRAGDPDDFGNHAFARRAFDDLACLTDTRGDAGNLQCRA